MRCSNWQSLHIYRRFLVPLTVQTAVYFTSVKVTVVYFDQLLGACSTQKLVETFFSAVFCTFACIQFYQFKLTC